MSYLRLRDDAYRTQTADSLIVLAHGGLSELRGVSASSIDQLAPYLDGRFTESQLIGRLPAKQRATASRFLALLRSHDLVRETAGPSTDDPGTGAEGAQRRYVGYFRDGAATVVSRFRSSTLTVSGNGPLAEAVAEAVLTAGVTSVHRRPSVLAASHVMVTVSSTGPPEVLTGHLTITGDKIWIGPVVAGSAPDAARRSWRLRRATWPHPMEQKASSGPTVPAGLAYRLAANQLLHWLFGRITGTAPAALDDPPETEREGGRTLHVVRFDIRTLASTPHRFLPHPFADPDAAPRGAEATRAAVANLAATPPVSPQVLARSGVACLDQSAGVLWLTEGGHAQHPLRICEARIADPVGLLTHAPRMWAAGPDPASTRHRAMLAGLARYCSLMVDPRRLLAADGGPLCRGGDDPAAALDTLRRGHRTGAVWGIDLFTGQPSLVDATAAFPSLLHTGVDQPPAGLAAGYGWHEAVLPALLDQCRHLAVAELATAQRLLPLLALDRLHLDEEGERYQRLLAATGEGLAAYDATGRLGVPTLAFCHGRETLAYASGATVADAARDGLLAALLRHQSADAAPAPVPALPASLRGRPGPPPPPVPMPAAGGAVDMVTAVAGRLAACGLRPIAIPLDHDPAVAGILPHVVQVVVRNG